MQRTEDTPGCRLYSISTQSCFKRESEEPSGVDLLIALAQDGYGLDKDQLVALVDESFEQAEGLARLFH